MTNTKKRALLCILDGWGVSNDTKYNAVSCGNCGFPIAQAALDYKQYKYFVLELSSFQLKGIKKFTPKIAVVTNVKQAHLDYHKSIEDYYKSKNKTFHLFSIFRVYPYSYRTIVGEFNLHVGTKYSSGDTASDALLNALYESFV